MGTGDTLAVFLAGAGAALIGVGVWQAAKQRREFQDALITGLRARGFHDATATFGVDAKGTHVWKLALVLPHSGSQLVQVPLTPNESALYSAAVADLVATRVARHFGLA